jgi:hypothetical protein
MIYYIIAEQKSLFVINKPLLHFQYHAEDMYWAMIGFETDNPKMTIIEIC